MTLQRPSRRSARPLCTLVLAMLACAIAAPDAASAATVPAVTSTSAAPAAFVPDWDGHTDSTLVSYDVVAASFVRVDLIDRRGRVRAVLARGPRRAGTHLVTWNGRDQQGRVLEPGPYRVRVAARPGGSVASAAGPDSAASGLRVVAGSRQVLVRLQAPPVVVRSVRLSRGAIGGRSAIGSTRASFNLPMAASVSAAVVGRTGKVLKNLHTGAMAAGGRSVAWDGTTTGGAPAPDGSYALLVSASGGGRPTSTLRLPIRVDRRAPGVQVELRGAATVTRSEIRIPLRVVLDEAATVVVGAGRRRAQLRRAAGTHDVAVRGSELGIAPAAVRRTVRVAVRAVDSTGNVAHASLLVPVPAVRSPRPVAPPPPPPPPPPIDPQPPTPGPPTVTPGAIAWPVSGTVTSPFGLRWGRLHQGIDIAVPTGSPIRAVAAGRVGYVGPMGGYGLIVILEHADGFSTYYAHMLRPASLVVGDAVPPGALLGLSGCSGSCTGPHLHFETRVAGVPRDPMAFLSRT